MQLSKGQIKLSPISSVQDALMVRIIRNESLELMTRNPDEITFSEQMKWFYEEYKKQNELKVYLVYLREDVIGYGLIRKDEECKYLAAVIKKEFRGNGYGTQLVTELTKMALPGEVRIEVRESNTTAEKICRNLGFEFSNICERPDIGNVLTFRRR